MWPLVTLIPLAAIIIPLKRPANLLLLLSLAMGLITSSLPPPLFVKGVTLTLALLYLTMALMALPAGRAWRLILFLPLLVLIPPLFLNPLLPLSAIILALLLILVMENVSRSFQGPSDRILFLLLLIPPIFATIYIYAPTVLHNALNPKESKTAAVFWLCIMEAINLSALATSVKGEVLRIQVRPSMEMTVKGLAFFLVAVYVLVVMLLNVATQGGSLIRTTRFLVVSGMVLGLVGVSWPRIRSYLLMHLYRERVDLHRLLAKILTSSTDARGYRETIKEFVEQLLKNGTLAGAQGALFIEGKEAFRHQAGQETPHQITHEQPLDHQWRTSLTLFFFHSPDKLDNRTASILTTLLAHQLTTIMAQERRVLEERLDLVEKLNRFIAHDLKNLAQTIKLYRQNLPLYTHQSPEEAQGDLEALFALLDQRTHKAIDNLTALAPPPPKPHSFSLKGSMERLVESLPFKDRIKIQGGDVQLFSDDTMVTTVVENLLMNAYQKDPSSIRITLRFWQKEDKVIIEVADNGAPVPPEDYDRIFEPFFSTRPQGTGLGLYTVKETIKVLKGEVSLYHKDKETVFKVTLPKDLRV